MSTSAKHGRPDEIEITKTHNEMRKKNGRLIALGVPLTGQMAAELIGIDLFIIAPHDLTLSKNQSPPPPLSTFFEVFSIFTKMAQIGKSASEREEKRQRGKKNERQDSPSAKGSRVKMALSDF